jgi:leucyl-tRNA synthetase
MQTKAMKYTFREIEAKWQEYWAREGTFRASESHDKPKYYALSMFPYPSGAGLHVGHPLGYIATDICARYKRHKGFNVLHPMGYDSFGLPAEQYAIQTGQHPAVTTEANIVRYREQLDKLGFSFDWSREVRTSDPQYYKWTQWIFIQLFQSWYNYDSGKAEPIDGLVARFAISGNREVNAACDEDTPDISASEWSELDEKGRQLLLLKYRLTFLSDTEVNWCPALGTVLANDEIVNGVSERGGYPVERKKMTQWSMRITAYAQRLLEGLDTIDWPQPLKDAQANWIGRSEGALVHFRILPQGGMQGPGGTETIAVFTTRPDTIFGASFMTLAPEHDLVPRITTPDMKEEVNAYVRATAQRSERDRLADVKRVSGAFTGSYAEHPFTKEPIPIWIGDYVLSGYGTGAVMSVPCGDQRDHDFARHFGLPIPNIFEGVDVSKEAFADKGHTTITNSDFLNGLDYKTAVKKIIEELEAIGQGQGRVNYRLRDAVFSRQRYWGEPFPVYYVDGLPRMIEEKYLPLKLPEVEQYLPTTTGDPPLGNATVWAWDTGSGTVVPNTRIDHSEVFPLELNTMPGWAGSSQYFNRYMDPHNEEEIFSRAAVDYWQDVDLYIGGIEHATGHLLYSRFWQHFLYDKGLVPRREYASKMINQGMILGESAFLYVIEGRLTKGDDFAPYRQVIVAKEVFDDLDSQKGDLSILPPELQKHFDAMAVIHLESNSHLDDYSNQFYAFKTANIDVSFVDVQDRLNFKGLSRDNRMEILQHADYFNGNAIIENHDISSKTDIKVSREVEKMSKSKYNVVNPDAICEEYGADSLRLYEMFLGPLEQAKPWNTAGITGVHGFLRKLWRLYHSGDDGTLFVSEEAPGTEALKALHRAIKKVEDDIGSFSFNTTVSSLMICVNELTAMNCHARVVLEPLAILVSPYAPHLAEELWEKLGHTPSIARVPFPEFDEKFLVEDQKEYPVSFNGKLRFTIKLPLGLGKDEIENAVMTHEKTRKQLVGKTPRKIIVVPGKIVNIVV